MDYYIIVKLYLDWMWVLEDFNEDNLNKGHEVPQNSSSIYCSYLCQFPHHSQYQFTKQFPDKNVIKVALPPTL